MRPTKAMEKTPVISMRLICEIRLKNFARDVAKKCLHISLTFENYRPESYIEKTK